jgi:serine/threonine protein kinase
MLKRIKDFHKMGYFHRDIKLNNFTINLLSDEKPEKKSA